MDVGDPVESGILEQYTFPYLNVTGVSEKQDMSIMFNFVKKLMPSARNVGALYSTSESNDASMIKDLELKAKETGFNILSVPVDLSREIPVKMMHF